MPGLRIRERVMGATIFGKIHNKKCCCSPGCTGCCFPADLSPIPFAIDAPGCSLDGYTDNLVEEAVDPTQHACGVCGSYILSTAFSVPGQFWNPDGMGGCDLIPACAITFCVRLICDGVAHPLGSTFDGAYHSYLPYIPSPR